MDIRKLLLPLSFAVGASAFAPLAAADDDFAYEPRSHTVTARVVRVEPIIRYVRVRDPRRECWDETYVESVPTDDYYDRSRGSYYDRGRGYDRRHGTNPANSALVGGLVGGVIGHQFGDGRGRDAATIAGALLGASMAHASAVERNGPRTVVDQKRTRTRCTDRYDDREEERIEGYRVTYVYDGQRYVTRMNHDPGDTVRVAISARVLRD